VRAEGVLPEQARIFIHMLKQHYRNG